MVTMFGLFAEIDRDLISERTREGLAAARAKGKVLNLERYKMNKMIILVCSLVMCITANANKFHHKSTVKLPVIKQQILNKDVTDFSGTWVGQCDNENTNIEIIQTSDNLRLKFYEEDNVYESIEFLINKINVNQTTSSKESTVDVTFSHANPYLNSVTLLSFDTLIRQDKNSSFVGFGTMAISVERQDNTLKISEIGNSGLTCLLSKQ